MDNLRNEIWDFLYRADRPQTIADIAQFVGSDEDTVRTAIIHDWFDVVDDVVTIAVAKS